MKYKLTRYDVVKKKCDFWGEEFEEDDNEATKEKEDFYMILSVSSSGYEIISLTDGNEECWWDEDFLEFVRKGSREEYLSIVRLIEAREEYKKRTVEIANMPKENSICDILYLIWEHKDKYTEDELKKVWEVLGLIAKKEIHGNEKR